MRVPIEVVQNRRERLAQLLQQNRYLGVNELCQRLKISAATARRDLAALAKDKRLTRTHGGALVDFNLRFPSFQQRQNQEAVGKKRIAEQAVRHIQPGMTIYLDAGTTIYFLAQLIVERRIQPLTVVTASFPVADLLAGGEGIRVLIPGGEFLRRQSVLTGSMTRKALADMQFDLAFMSAEGVNNAGLWNSQAEMIKAQRVVLRRSRMSYACVDSSKFGKVTKQFLAKFSRRLGLISDLSPRAVKKMLQSNA